MQDDEQEIRQLVSTWMAAHQSGRCREVLSLMSETLSFSCPATGMRKADFARRCRPAGQTLRNLTDQRDSRIKILATGPFVDQLTVVVTPPGGAPPMTRAGHTLSILQKQNGKWVLARDAKSTGSRAE